MLVLDFIEVLFSRLDPRSIVRKLCFLHSEQGSSLGRVKQIFIKDLSKYYEPFRLYGMAYSVRQEYILALVRFPSKALNHMLSIST